MQWGDKEAFTATLVSRDFVLWRAVASGSSGSIYIEVDFQANLMINLASFQLAVLCEIKFVLLWKKKLASL